nr:hypothetical protein [Photorhabdus akhurstii]
MRPALMVPQPLHTIPDGLATITCALPPATSRKPRNWLGLLLFTSLIMIWAGAAFGSSRGLPCIIPASWVEVITAELLRMAPLWSTSNCL